MCEPLGHVCEARREEPVARETLTQTLTRRHVGVLPGMPDTTWRLAVYLTTAAPWCGLDMRTGWKASRMDERELVAQSFVVKIWLEELDGETGRSIWRGRVTHVPSGEHHNFSDFAVLVATIATYLEAPGIKAAARPPSRSILSWWRRKG